MTEPKKVPYPNSDEALERDLTDPADYEDADPNIVKSSEPDSQEWGAREDQNDLSAT